MSKTKINLRKLIYNKILQDTIETQIADLPQKKMG